ncbi:MAG: esterase [Gammaproteobacteria bacterium]|jgi:esterase
MAVQLSFETFGTGKPVIIMHGLFGSARNWRSIAKQLGDEYQVFVVDLRNHGRSDHADSMYYMEMVDDIRKFLHDRHIDRVSLAGHSMGGKTAMAFALEYEEIVEKLIVLDIAPVQYTNDFDHLVDSMLALDLSIIKSRTHANDLLKTDIEDGSLRLFLLQNLIHDEQSYQWRINLPAIKAALPDIGAFPTFTLNSIYSGPTLFLSGDKSDYIQPSYHEDIKSFFPEAKIRSITNAEHWLHADQPQLVFEEISRFLND